MTKVNAIRDLAKAGVTASILALIVLIGLSFGPFAPSGQATYGTVASVIDAVGRDTGGLIPADLPAYPGWRGVTATPIPAQGVTSISASSSDDEERIVEFYQRQLPQSGWTKAREAERQKDTRVLVYGKDARTLLIGVTPAELRGHRYTGLVFSLWDKPPSEVFPNEIVATTAEE